MRNNFQAAHDEIGAIQACGLPTPATLGSGTLIAPSTQPGGNLGPGWLNCRRITINQATVPVLFNVTDTRLFLQLSGGANQPVRLFLDSYGTGGIGTGFGNRCFPGSPGQDPQPPCPNGLNLGAINFQSSTGIAFSDPAGGFIAQGAWLGAVATENWSHYSNGAQFQIQVAPNGGTYRMMLTVDSNLTLVNGNPYWAGGGAWMPITSSRDSKKNITNLSLGLADLVKLRPVTFEFNGTHGAADDGIRRHGLIAEEVREAIPELVREHTVHVRHEDAPPEDHRNISVDPNPILYGVINALKEINQRLTALERSQPALETIMKEI